MNIIIDEIDENLLKHGWYNHNGYARATIKGDRVYLHRLVLGSIH